MGMLAAMPTFQRPDIAKLIKQIQQGQVAPVYLLLGERYLCREAAEQLIGALLPDQSQRGRQLTVIDGEREDHHRTLAALRTYSLFGGRQILMVQDSRLFLSKTVARTLWEKAEKALDNGESGEKEAARLLLAMLDLAGLSLNDWQQEQPAAWSAGQWQKVFGFAKPAATAWAATILAGIEAGAAPPTGGGKADAAEAYQAAIEAGLPPNNILLLLADTVDRRKKFFKFLDKNGVILDLAVDSGSSAPARKARKSLLADLVRQTLADFDKTLAPDALDPLLERIGFLPVAVVMECEKLALYVGERPRISRQDVDAMVARTREDAIYELSEAHSSGNLQQSLTLCRRLKAGGMHPLALLAGLRNHLRKLLLARALLAAADLDFNPAPPFPVFQQSLLPRLKEQREAAGRDWPAAFSGHPYALYQLLIQAGRHSPANLKAMLAQLLQAEYRLKGSGLPEDTILSALFFNTASEPG